MLRRAPEALATETRGVHGHRTSRLADHTLHHIGITPPEPARQADFYHRALGPQHKRERDAGRRRHRIRAGAAATDSSLNDGPFALHNSSSRAWRASFRDSQLPHLKERAMSQRTRMKGGFVLSVDPHVGDLPTGDVLMVGKQADIIMIAAGRRPRAEGSRQYILGRTGQLPAWLPSPAPR
jgi:hypothetical protein